MIIDKENEFSSAQAETTVATHASTKDIDLGKAGDAATELYLVICVHTKVESEGNATINLQLITSASADLSNPVTLWETGALAKTVFTKGKKWTLRVPKGALQYLRVNYVIDTAVLTAGKFNAFLTPVPDTNN